MAEIKPALADIPETMLWTLHNRAAEAVRKDAVINDPLCLEIYRALDYDYEKHFGKADGSHGVRSWLFDQQIRAFLQQNPDGVIVNLGEGLETQRFRIEAPASLWLCVDLPQAIGIRERFIQPDERHLHIAANALDTQWFDAVPEGRKVFVTAQGLFMYFTPLQVQTLLEAIASRFVDAWLMFDYIPPSLSNKTLSSKGWMKTPHYRTPPMPWGVKRNELTQSLEQWLGSNTLIQPVEFMFPRGMRRLIMQVLIRIPAFLNLLPGVMLCKLSSVKAV